jgi:SPW repeat-containing protein
MYWITGILGILLMSAPYLLGYADNFAAYWTSLTIGLIVSIASIWEGVETRKENWEYWVAVVCGIFAILAPFIFGYGWHAEAMWASVVVGFLIALFAGSKLWSVSS